MIGLLEGFPTRFSSPEDVCDTFDEREYCQMVQQNDLINFAWQTFEIGQDVVVCGGFETEVCILANWTLNGPWNFIGDSSIVGFGMIYIGEPGALGTESDTAIQEDILTPGCWKITITVPGYPCPFGAFFEKQEYEGSFHIETSDSVSESIQVTPGVHTFYLNTTAGGDLIIVPEDAILYIKEVTAVQICCDYSLIVKDLEGNEIDTYEAADFDGSTNGFFIEDNIAYFKARWSDFGLENGCYRLCIKSNCNLVSGGLFASSAEFDYWEGDANWTLSGGKACHSAGSTGQFYQRLNLTTGQNYTVSVVVTDMTAGSLTIMVGGVVAGVITYTSSLNIDINADQDSYIRFIPTSDFDGCIDNATVTLVADDCSQCYSLKDEYSCTKLLKWTNDDDAFGVPYSSIDFANYLRINALIEKPRYPQESDRFQYSDGERKILYATSEKIWTLAIDYLPQYLHDAIALAKIHDHFYIDGVEYICEAGNYEPEWRGRNRIAQSKIEIQKVVDNNRNKNC